MLDLDSFSLTDIQGSLAHAPCPSYDIPEHATAHHTIRQAGVLVPFIRQHQAWHILFIRRPHSERDQHSNQVAFAGGKRDPDDLSIVHTALREAHEEIGIQPNDVTVLGSLCPHYSISHFQITPTIGSIPAHYPLQLNKREVARAFTIPLTWLAQPENHHLEYRTLPSMKHPVPIVYFKEYDNELLWGASARIMLTLLQCLQHTTLAK